MLGRDPGDFSDFIRAKMPRHVPAAMSGKDMAALLAELTEPYRTIALLLFGSGLRLTECLELRVGSLGFDQGIIRVTGAIAGSPVPGAPPAPAPCGVESALAASSLRVTSRFP